MARGDQDHEYGEHNLITCTNEFAERFEGSFLTDADDSGAPATKPPRVKHVTCTQRSSSQEKYSVEWVPDGKRGWRIAAIALTEADYPPSHLFVVQLPDLASPTRCQAPPRPR